MTTGMAQRAERTTTRSTQKPAKELAAGNDDADRHSAPLPIKTRRRCIMYILETLAGDKPLSMDDMMRVLVRSTPQVRRLLKTIRRLYMIRIELRKGRYRLDPRYSPDEILAVAYKILRGNDQSACETMLLMNLSRLRSTEESLVALRHSSNNRTSQFTSERPQFAESHIP